MTIIRRAEILFLVGGGGLVLVLAACGGSETSGGDSNDVDATTTTTRSDATTTTTVADPGSDFVTPELGNTSWNVTRYELPTGGMTNLWPGTEITVSFGADGTISGFSGCNTYSGTYTVAGPYNKDSGTFGTEQEGQAIETGSFALTEIGCTEPRNVMEQEGEYIDDLRLARFWLLNNSGDLILHGSDGFFLIQGEPAT